MIGGVVVAVAISLELPTGLAQVGAPVTALASPKPDQYSQKLVVIDPLTGEPMVAKYTLLKCDQIIQKGKTDSEGCPRDTLMKDDGDLEVLIGASDPWSVRSTTVG